MSIRYILPKDIRTLFSVPFGVAERIIGLHNRDTRNPTFCNIVERQTVNGVIRYKIRISLSDGSIKEGWTPGYGLDPVIYDPEGEMLDGRFNL